MYAAVLRGLISVGFGDEFFCVIVVLGLFQIVDVNIQCGFNVLRVSRLKTPLFVISSCSSNDIDISQY